MRDGEVLQFLQFAQRFGQCLEVVVVQFQVLQVFELAYLWRQCLDVVVLEGDVFQFGEFADDGWNVCEAVGTDHQFLEVLELADFLGQRVETIAEEVECLGIGIGIDFLHQAFGAAVGNADFLLALCLGVAAKEQKGSKKEDERGLFHFF